MTSLRIARLVLTGKARLVSTSKGPLVSTSKGPLVSTSKVLGTSKGFGLIASLLLGLGFTFFSGAVEAWLVDALAATGFVGELEAVFGRGQMVTGPGC